MILDYNAQTRAYILKVPRGPEVRAIMSEHGFDFSTPASTPETAVLFSREPYAAVAFYNHATPAAQAQLQSIQNEVEASWAKESKGHIKVPMDEELAPFQIAGVEYALRRNNTLFGDVPGLGKSPEAIAFCNEIGAKRILCICPANIRLQWVKVFRRWTTMEWPYTVYPILSGRRGVHPTANFTVVSYDLASTPAIGRALAKGTYDVIIIDEGHYCKTVDTRRTRAIFGGGIDPQFEFLAGRAGAILSLTGTPLPNRPREAYTLARGLCLGAQTRVLTNHGVKRIVDVLKEDELWDGTQWVRHSGVISKGLKPVIGTALEATPNHRVLAGGAWTTWQSVLDDASTQSRALATGWESLRSLAMLQGKAAFVSRCHARAVDSHIRSLLLMPETEEACAVKHVATNCSPRPTAGAIMSSWTSVSGFVGLFSGASATSLDDVKTPEARGTTGMALGASGSGRSGSEIGPHSSDTLPSCLTVELPVLNWTALTTTKAMSLGTCDGSPKQTILRTEEPSPAWNDVSENSKPVYDIVNAGPRHRFTVITDAGPLIVHNCFDSIDFMSEDRFRERFNPSMRIEREDPATGRKKFYIDERSGRHGELQSRLRANFMVRREKYGPNGVGYQLGMMNLPRFDIIHVEEDEQVKRALSAEAMLDIDPEDFEGADAEVLGHIAVVRQMMGLALAPHTVEYTKMLLEGGEDKVLVFAHHIAVLDILCDGLKKYGVRRIDGSLNPVKKQKFVDEFRADKSIRVCIGNMQSMGTGTDGLQEVCNRAVFGESDWTHGANQQAVDRLDRPGQLGLVQADFLVAPGSFSERILASALRKLQTTNKALDRRV